MYYYLHYIIPDTNLYNSSYNKFLGNKNLITQFFIFLIGEITKSFFQINSFKSWSNAQVCIYIIDKLRRDMQVGVF